MPLNKDPLWYKDAIIYQVHVRTFYDSNGDGVGDFPGLEQKLEYLQELGINAIWLMPFFPSPLRDDGYDIADYKSVHASYGNSEDFKRFLDSAHERGIRVIIEMVLNHTSDQHPWFQRARRAPAGIRCAHRARGRTARARAARASPPQPRRRPAPPPPRRCPRHARRPTACARHPSHPARH